MEGYGLWLIVGGAFYAAEGEKEFEQFVAAFKQLIRLVGLGTGSVDELCCSISDVADVFCHYDGIGREQRGEGDEGCWLLGQRWDEEDGLLLVNGELGLDVESADAVDFVAEEVDTEGDFGGVGEDIEDGAAESELSGLVNVVGLLKAKTAELCLRAGRVGLLVLGETQGARVERGDGHGSLDEGLGIGDDAKGKVSICEAGEHLRAEDDVGVVLLSVFVGAAIRGRKKKRAVVAEYLHDVVAEGCCLVRVV